MQKDSAVKGNPFLFGFLISYTWQFYFFSYLNQFGGGHTKVDEK